jgi:hypothetical protein
VQNVIHPALVLLYVTEKQWTTASKVAAVNTTLILSLFCAPYELRSFPLDEHWYFNTL